MKIILRPGAQLPEFVEEGHPSAFSVEDMNNLVRFANAFLRLKITRGQFDAVFVSDNNVVLQIGGSENGGNGNGEETGTVNIQSCTTGETYVVSGHVLEE